MENEKYFNENEFFYCAKKSDANCEWAGVDDDFIQKFRLCNAN
jgi:hypothetical protein